MQENFGGAPCFAHNAGPSIAKGSLEDAGIPFWMHGDESAARLALSPVIFPLCELLATRECEAEAREVLASLELPRL